MQKRRLGNTNMDVSPLGLGTVKFGRHQGVRYPTAFELPSDVQIEALLAQAESLGINVLDTAPAYGTSEIRLGKLLRGKRHHWAIVTKVGEEFTDGESQFDFSKQAILSSVERSLTRLHTDYLDIVLVHSNGEDERIIADHEVFQTLEQLKKAGKVRAYGMSTKTIGGGLATLSHADVAMVTFNPLAAEEREVIAFAHRQQKGILIKKALASGHLQKFASPDPVSDAFRFIFSEPGVTSVIIGTINPKHLQQNVESAMRVLGEAW